MSYRPTTKYFIRKAVINLYEGTGDPCAGQARLNGCKAGLATLELDCSTENLGADPPIGSVESEYHNMNICEWGPMSYVYEY